MAMIWLMEREYQSPSSLKVVPTDAKDASIPRLGTLRAAAKLTVMIY
jgi:hypothetical protein